MRLSEITGSEAARRLAASETTSEALVAACLERIAERDEQVRAWAFIDRAAALAQARSLDRAPRRSRLHGVPFGIKDIIDTADLPTEYNSAIYRGHRPKADAACVTLLKQAGCVILGKTVTTEFANNHPSQTRNPHNGAHTPGGSSSGSAAAVADFMVPLALGTQTGGSVIRPAAYCGAYAIKPSFGAINRAGTKFLAESLDTIGIFARCAGDLALAMEVLTGRAGTRPPAGAPRIGLCRTPRWSLADAATQANVEQAARALERAGAAVRDFELPAGSAELFDRHKVIMGYETARALGWEYRNHRSELSATLKRDGACRAPSTTRCANRRGGCVASSPSVCARSISSSRRARRAKRRRRSQAQATRCSTAPGRCSAFPASPSRTAKARAACRSPCSSSARTRPT